MSLVDAIKARDLVGVRSAIASRIDVNEILAANSTPLILAATLGFADVIALLLEAGAEPSWKDADQETAILKAGANGHAEAVRALIPVSSDDDIDMANAFLKSFGASHGPEYQYDGSKLQKKAVEVVARAAKFVGHDGAQARVDRMDRAQKKR